MAKGGAAAYRKGAARERAVKRELEDRGWLCTRQPASHSPYDLHCMHPNGMTFLIQVKTRKYLPKAEREDLVALGKRFNVWAMWVWGKGTPDETEVLHYPSYAREATSEPHTP